MSFITETGIAVEGTNALQPQNILPPRYADEVIPTQEELTDLLDKITKASAHPLLDDYDTSRYGGEKMWDLLMTERMSTYTPMRTGIVRWNGSKSFGDELKLHAFLVKFAQQCRARYPNMPKELRFYTDETKSRGPSSRHGPELGLYRMSHGIVYGETRNSSNEEWKFDPFVGQLLIGRNSDGTPMERTIPIIAEGNHYVLTPEEILLKNKSWCVFNFNHAHEMLDMLKTIPEKTDERRKQMIVDQAYSFYKEYSNIVTTESQCFEFTQSMYIAGKGRSNQLVGSIFSRDIDPRTIIQSIKKTTKPFGNVNIKINTRNNKHDIMLDFGKENDPNISYMALSINMYHNIALTNGRTRLLKFQHADEVNHPTIDVNKWRP